MLVLSRKRGERIVIGGNIVIEIVQLGGSSVRIGIDAPTDVRIDRGENVKTKENKRAEDRQAESHQ